MTHITGADTPFEAVAAADQGAADIVLPWWQNPINIVTMVVATALLAGMIGWLWGESDTGIASSEADVGFLQDMRVHHEQAVQIGNVYLDRPDIDGDLGTIARGVVFGQSIEIGLMIQLLRDMDAPTESDPDRAMAWMGMPGPVSAMPGMASDDQIRDLGASEGLDADRLFVELMIAHHEGGIDMMESALDRAENPDVRAYAAAWRDSQAHEIIELETQLSERVGRANA